MYKQFIVIKNKFKKNENHPDFKMSVKCDPKEITKKDGSKITVKSELVGACWKKTSPSGEPYLSCKFDDDQKKDAGNSISFSTGVDEPF